MDISTDGNEFDPYMEKSLDSSFYLCDVGIINSALSKNHKSCLSGGYDSGVDSVSCKSSEDSRLNTDIDDETLIKPERSFKANIPENKLRTLNHEEGYNKRCSIQFDLGLIPKQVQKQEQPPSIYCKAKYGWVVVFSCFWLNVIQAGIAFCGGIVLHAIAEEFGETRSRVSLISSFFNGFLLCSAPIVERLVNKMGLRITCVSGSFIAAAAFTASIFSPNLNIMIITQGIIAGIGIGLVYFPSIIAPSFYFEDNKAVAYGIGICGQGI